MLLPAIHFGQLLNTIFESTILHLLSSPKIFNCGGVKVLQWMMPSYPPDNAIHNWHPGLARLMRLLHWYNFNSDVLDKEEGRLEMLRSILAQHDYKHQVNSWHAQGVPFKDHPHVPEKPEWNLWTWGWKAHIQGDTELSLDYIRKYTTV